MLNCRGEGKTLSSSFPEAKPGDSGVPVPLPAELEFIVRRGGEWVKTSLVDPDSNGWFKGIRFLKMIVVI